MIKKLLLACLCTILSSYCVAEVLHSERSLYRKVFVEDQDNIRCLKFSLKRKTSSQSCINKLAHQQLVFKYTKLLMSSLLLVEKPNNILIIGLGGGTMSNTLHELYPAAKIINVEIDPAVINVARKYFFFKENEQVSTVAKDGRIFVKRAKLKKQTYDLVILDAFNGDYIPEHLMTKEFLSEIKDILSPNGVVAANTFSNSKLYQHESATYQAVFPNLYNVQPDKNSNRVLLGMKNDITDANTLQARAQALQPKLQPYLIDITSYLPHMHKQKIVTSNIRLLTDQYSPANLIK